MNYAQEIKDRVPARDLFEFYGFHANRAGFVCCPLHGEKTPSLKVYPGSKGWKCFGCGAGSSVIDFVMMYFGLPFDEAQKKINEDFRLGLPIGEKMTFSQMQEAERKAYERKKAQRERQEEHERLQATYWKALITWIWLDNLRRDLAPNGPEDGFNDGYVYAVTWIDAVGAELDDATDRLDKFEKPDIFEKGY